MDSMEEVAANTNKTAEPIEEAAAAALWASHGTRAESGSGRGNTDNDQAHKSNTSSTSSSNHKQPGKVRLPPDQCYCRCCFKRQMELNANNNNTRQQQQLMYNHVERPHNHDRHHDEAGHSAGLRRLLLRHRSNHLHRPALGDLFVCLLPMRDDNWPANEMRLRIGKPNGSSPQWHLAHQSPLMSQPWPHSARLVVVLVEATNKVYNSKEPQDLPTNETTKLIISRQSIVSNKEELLVDTNRGGVSGSSSRRRVNEGYDSGGISCTINNNNEINNKVVRNDEIIKQPMRKAQLHQQQQQQQQQPRQQVSFRRKQHRGSCSGTVSNFIRRSKGGSFSSVWISFIVKLFLICHSIQSFLSLLEIDQEQLVKGTGSLGKIHHNDGHLPIRADFRSLWRHSFRPTLFVMAHQEPPDGHRQQPFIGMLNVDWLSVVGLNETSPLKQLNTNNNNYNVKAQGKNAADSGGQSLNGLAEKQEQHPTTTPFDHMFMRHEHNHHRKRKHKHHHHHSNNHESHHETGSRSGRRTGDDDDDEILRNQKNQRVRRNHDGGIYDSAAADRPVVASRKGLVRGVTQKLFTGKFVDAFLGLPYAKPPIGNYRFRHPQPTDPWQGELEASRLPNSCFQMNDTFFGANFQGTRIWNANTPLSEDCLYLNIWTPFGVANTTVPSVGGNPTTQQQQQQQAYRPSSPYASGSDGKKIASKRPVLVWIFGGGFYYGTSTLALYEGGLLASEEDIIVVSINYRVSALGFLYLGRPDAPGNAGLFDQLLALQWIQDNIEQFGGDPDRVTIFGESAGAVSAAFHLLSPLSRNLFSQAILQSGAATCPWGCKEPREIMTNGLKLASLMNCPSNASDLDSVVDCLVHVDPMAMVMTAQDVDPNRSLLNFPFVPVVDGSFLLETPQESLIKSNFKRARILLGSNYDEGSAFLIYLTEFNHCPGGGGGGGNGNGNGNANNDRNDELADQVVITSKPLAGQEPQTAGDFRSDQLANMESSMEQLVAANQQQSAALLLASPVVGPANEGASSGGRPTQHNLPPNYSDSNPCKPNESPSLTREGFLRTLKDYLNPYAEHPIGKEAIVFEYSNWNNPQDSISNYDALDKIVGDYHFTCHVNEFAYRYASTGNAVYMYYFKQRSSVSQWPKWMGVLHGDEIAFVFGEPLNPALNYTSKEVDLSRRMMRYWANFARFGNPTKSSENVTMSEKWPEYGNNRQFFELHSEFIRLGRGPRAKQCAFWAHYLPKLIDSFDHSQCPASSGNGPSASGAASTATLNGQYRCPPTRYHPQDPRLLANNQRNGLLNNLPSLVIVSLSVILVLSIIGLLIYAKRTGKLELNLSGSSGSD